ASFRFHLTMNTLAFGYILPTTGWIPDFHRLETCTAGRTVSEKKSPKELLSPQIIFFFIEGSPVDDPTVLQNRNTMGVQIPSTFPKSLDFKPFQPKVRFLGKL
ncbi:MAG: hypothetical protein MR966_09070, partial [Lachnospiraceae bacterium]|nr:hypothetical protein [Lachnospiraceae bacterium]